MDSLVMERLLEASPELGKTEVHRHFLRYTPLYLYVSPDFNRRHPEFLDGFNTYLANCLNGQFALDDDEKATLMGLANEVRDTLAAELDLQEAILAGPRMDSLPPILKADPMWQAFAPEQLPGPARQTLHRPAYRPPPSSPGSGGGAGAGGGAGSGRGPEAGGSQGAGAGRGCGWAPICSARAAMAAGPS